MPNAYIQVNVHETDPETWAVLAQVFPPSEGDNSVWVTLTDKSGATVTFFKTRQVQPQDEEVTP